VSTRLLGFVLHLLLEVSDNVIAAPATGWKSSQQLKDDSRFSLHDWVTNTSVHCRATARRRFHRPPLIQASTLWGLPVLEILWCSASFQGASQRVGVPLACDRRRSRRKSAGAFLPGKTRCLICCRFAPDRTQAVLLQRAKRRTRWRCLWLWRRHHHRISFDSGQWTTYGPLGKPYESWRKDHHSVSRCRWWLCHGRCWWRNNQFHGTWSYSP
jgi:hypothetical protein